MRTNLPNYTCMIAVTIVACLATPSLGQGLFGGSGTRVGSAKQRTSQPAKRTGLFSFGQGNSSEASESGKSLNPFSKFFAKRPESEAPKSADWSKLKMPGFGSEKQAVGNRESSSGASNGFPNWLPKRDPNKPSFFQKMNSQSKAMMKSASDWTQQTTGLGKKPDPTWDEIRKEMESIEKQNAARNGPSIKPPVRSARRPSEPRFKF